MKRLLNTLYITSPDLYLGISGENVLIKKEDDIVGRYPLHNLCDIVMFSYLGMSPKLVEKCVEYGIGISYMTHSGRFNARIQGKTTGNVLLRRTQYRIADNKVKSLEIAKNIILAKIYNERWNIERYIREYSLRIDTNDLKKASVELVESMKEAKNCISKDSLRGIEGYAQSIYFGVFNTLILNQKESFSFTVRSRRPPLDRVNALLSYMYSILGNEIAGALESVGLDPYVGVMHVDRPGRISLALDILEELRAPVADRFVLKLINMKILKKDDFVIESNGAVSITDGAKKQLLTAWQKRKQEVITHPFIEEKIEWGMVPYAQALLLARFYRGDLDTYPAFLWK